MLPPAGSVDHDLRHHQRADRRVAHARAGDADHEEVIDVERVEEAFDVLGRQPRAHAGDDADDVALPHPAGVHGQAVHLGLDQAELARQRHELHRHGTHEGDRLSRHGGMLPRRHGSRQRPPVMAAGDGRPG